MKNYFVLGQTLGKMRIPIREEKGKVQFLIEAVRVAHLHGGSTMVLFFCEPFLRVRIEESALSI